MGLDAAAKQRLRDVVRAQVRAEVDADHEHLRAEESAARLDPQEGHAIDALSRSDEAGDLAGLAQQSEDAHRATLAAIDALDLSPTDVVRPGAVVSFGGGAYLVGVPMATVALDGVEYEGIAPDSPAYSQLEGKREGETFDLNGRVHTLDAVS